MSTAKNYAEILQELKKSGYAISEGIPQINIPNAAETLSRAAAEICRQRGQLFEWSHDYGAVVQWLTDNKRKGLMLIGTCGNGKTLLLDAIALVLLAEARKVCHKVAATEVTTAKDAAVVCRQRFAIVDDIGTEADLVDYGTRKTFVSEIVDAMERNGNLVMLSTNLDGSALLARYGERTLDRLRGNMHIVKMKGLSKRR